MSKTKRIFSKISQQFLKQNYAYILFSLSFSIIYGLILSNLDGIFRVPFDFVNDRVSYLTYAASSGEIFNGYLDTNPFLLTLNEPVFLLINMALKAIGFDSEQIVRIIILIPASITAWYTLSRNRKHVILALFILLLPQILVNFIMTLRQGLAISIFLVGWYSLNRWIKWICIGLAPFIHISFLMVYFVFVFGKLLRRKNFGIAINLAIVVFVCFAINKMALDVAGIFGLRQFGNYQTNNSTESTGFGFIFWLLLFFLYLSQGKRYEKVNFHSFDFIILYLISYYMFTPLARAFQNIALIVLVSGFGLKRYRFILFSILIEVGVIYFLFKNVYVNRLIDFAK